MKTNEAMPPDSPYVFVGHVACIDFVNTQLIRDGRLTDLITGFDDFVRWLVEAGLLDAAQGTEALRRWSGKREGTRALRQAREFRAALRRMIERAGQGRPVEQSTIEAINNLLGKGRPVVRLDKGREGFEKRREYEFAEADQLLAPVAESAGDLLCEGHLDLIKKCESSSCVLYFYDTTKNHGRRWCRMESCGNRTKAAAHYRRTRKAAGKET